MARKISVTNSFVDPKYSLERRVFKVTLIGTFILGMLLLCIFTGLYLRDAVYQQITEAFAVIKSARLFIDSETNDLEKLTLDVMDAYHALNEEQLNTMGTAVYRGRFAEFLYRDDYKKLYNSISFLSEDNPMEDIYIGVFDVTDNRLIYICDTDDRDRIDYLPGEWEYVTAEEIDKFVNWDGNGRLYDIYDDTLYGLLCTVAVPLFAAEDYTAFVLADVLISDIIKSVLSVLPFSLLMLVFAAVIISLGITSGMRNVIVSPVNEIASAAKQYVEDRKTGVRGDNHFSSLKISGDNEISNLRDVMAEMETGLNEYQDNLTRITADRERMAAELGLAQRIQADALPNRFPAFPDREEFDLYAAMYPAKEIGGDFYDFYFADEDHLCLTIADVSGKGIPASLFMMASKIVISDNAKSGCSPKEILETANRSICNNNIEKMFVTAWVGILELSTGILTAASAGHEYPVFTSEEGRFELFKDPHGFILGGLHNMKYPEYSVRLKPGDTIFVYTDGLTEAGNTDNEMYGTERMLDVLNSSPDASPDEIIRNMVVSVAQFAGEAEQSDDLTMLCVKYLGPKDSSYRQIVVPGTTDQIEPVTDFVNGILEETGCSFRTQTQIDIAIDEIFSNIAHYGYRDQEGDVTVRAQISDGVLRLTFSDRGRPFNPLDAERPDTTLAADDRQIGGLGIFLVKKTMDNMEYRYEDGKNILSIEKKL